MKKKLLIFIIGIIVLIGLVVGVYYFSISEPTTEAIFGECSGGTTVLGITNAHITTSSDLGGKEVLRIIAVANGGGECLTIGFDGDDIIDELGDEYDVESGVFGDLITKLQTQTFTSSQKSGQIYKISRGEKQSGTLCSVSNCEKDYNNVINSIRTFPVTGTCYCYFKNLIGREGQFDSTSKKDFEVEFSIDGLGSTTLSSGQQSGKIGSNAFIKWSGDLFSGTWLSTPNYDTYLQIADNEWRMTNDGYYDDISDRLEDDEDCISRGYTVSCCGGISTNPITCSNSHMNQYNTFVDLKLSNKDNTFISQESSVESGDWNGNKFITDLATQTTWQVFTIDIDADWVGIHKLVGIPEVKCPSETLDVTSGQSRTIEFKVRDKAGTNPSFGLNLVCASGSGSLQQSRINNVGTTYEEVNGYVTISTTTEKDFSCTFEAYDLNEPDNKDSCTASFKGRPFTGCILGEKVCSSDGKELGTCNPTGTNFDFISCIFGCEAFENTYRCRLQAIEICDDGIDNDGDGFVDMDDPDCEENGGKCGWWIKIPEFTILGETYGGWGIIPDVWCHLQNWLVKFRLIFAIVLGAFGGLLAGSYSYIFVKKQENKIKWIVIISSVIILGLAAGYLAWIYFWWILLALIILGIIRAFIPGI